MICHRLAKQGAIRRFDEVCYFPSLELIRFQPDQVCGAVVCKQYALVVYEYDFR